MNPDKSRLGGDLQAQPHGGAPGDDTSVVTTPETTQSQQMAAANVIRSRIDHLYESDLGVATEVTPTEPNTQNVYHRTHTQHPLPGAVETVPQRVAELLSEVLRKLLHGTNRKCKTV
jgi:hypothetical protein